MHSSRIPEVMEQKSLMRKLNIKKEEVAEDYCFVCKDGGLLLICDYKHCLKAYHPQCVGKDDTFLETGERWTCSWHSCFICSKKPKFHCFCCPNAVCQRCIRVAEFVQVRGNKGFCNNCLKLALLIEENVDIDSDGGKVDFKDRETCEFLFMEYWEIVKKKEHLKLEALQVAYNLLKKGDNYQSELDSDCEKMDGTMEDGELQWMEEPEGQNYFSMKMMKRKVRSKKKEFIGWGSKQLIEFLTSVGIDTSKQFSPDEVSSIIREYVNKNSLMHPVRKKRVLCDERLHSIFGRKSISRNKIDDLLESHFSENMEDSEEDEFKCSSEDMEEDTSKASEKRRISSSERPQKRKKDLEVPQSCFASITPRNIKLVYLKRSLVESLLKNPETFEEKVVGSFVRVKCDPNDYLQRCSHKLVQVTGIKNASGMGNSNAEIILQVSNMKKETCIRLLSDDNFLEEECDDLRQRVKDGLIKKPTIVELEQKARILHEDITIHWVDREIASLQNLIERANEKGWRKELAEYLERKQLLLTPSERVRLLQETPTIIAEELEPEATPEDPTQMVAKTDIAGDGVLLDWKSGNGKVGDQNSVLVQGKKDRACVAEHSHQSGKLDEKPTGIQAQQSLQPIKLDEKPMDIQAQQSVKLDEKLMDIQAQHSHQSGKLDEKPMDIQAQQSHQSVKLDEKPTGIQAQHSHQSVKLNEKPTDMGFAAAGQQVQEKEVEESSRENLLACDTKQHHQEGKVAESSTEKQLNVLQIDEESNGVVQQQETCVSVDAEGSTCGSLIPLSGDTQKEDQQPVDDEHPGGEIVDLDENDGNCTTVNRQRISAVQVVEVSDDEEIRGDQRCPASQTQNQNLEDPSRSIWYYVDPYKEIQGPFPMSALKRWYDSNYFAPDFKVWKTDQSLDDAILLTDALCRYFP